jgi:serine/threonine-protein kinase
VYHLLNNRYRIIATLGQGGCGQTFLAEDTHLPSNQRCVVKQLQPATNDPTVYRIIKERFQREAVILEALGNAHNQIPRLHAYFTENQEFYLVQDYIEGQNLFQRVMDAGPFSPAEVHALLLQILPLLGYVHSQGIIHRDLKPDNIMLRQSDGKPVLIDFGAVKETVTTVVNSQGLPTSSIVIGSPGFMPMEQAIGHPVFASDLYSLGMTAIFLLTGRRPPELTNLSTGQVDWRPAAPWVPPQLAQVIDKATQRMAENRYQTAREMEAALQLASTLPMPQPTPEPVPNPVPPPAPPRPSWSPLLPVLALVATLLVAVIGGLLIKIKIDQDRLERERIQALQASERAESARREAERKAAAEKAERERLEAERQAELERLKPVVTVSELRSEHNAFEGGVKGMRIHFKLNLKNYKDTPCRASAYFSFQNGTALKDFNGKYRTDNGEVSSGDDFTPSYDNTEFSDFKLFIPLDELHITAKGEYELRYYVRIYRQSDNETLAESDYVNFTYTVGGS